MGCISVLKYRKKKSRSFVCKSSQSMKEKIACTLPEPDPHERSLQSAPPSFRTKSSRAGPRLSDSRARASSAPSSLVVDDKNAFASVEFEDHEKFQSKGGSMMSHRYSNPLPLPLPSSPGSSVTKKWGSFKPSNASGLITMSGPLPLSPSSVGGLRNFSYDEISAACLHFSVDRCMSDDISATLYKATFTDGSASLKNSEATVARLINSS